MRNRKLFARCLAMSLAAATAISMVPAVGLSNPVVAEAGEGEADGLL